MKIKSDNVSLLKVFTIILIYLVFAYITTLSFDFVWDDNEFLVDNLFLGKWSSIISSFFDAHTFAISTKAQIYRPIRNIFWIIELKVFGKSSSYFHLINLIFHYLNSILFFYLLHFTFNLRRGVALIASIIFVVHPLSTEVVCWIKSFDDLLVVFFGLLSFILFSIYLRTKETKFVLFFFSLSFMLMLFSKESGSFLVFVFIIFMFFEKQITIKHKLQLSILLLLELFIYLTLRFFVLRQFGQVGYLAGGFFRTQLGMSQIYFQYILKFFFPFFQRVNYIGYSPFANYSKGFHFVLWVLLIYSLIILIKYFKKSRIEICYLILSFVPVSNIVPMMQWQAERFLYFPLVFILIFISKTYSIYFHLESRKIILHSLLIISVFFTFLTYKRSLIWKNSRNLGFSMLESNPYSYHGLYMLMHYNSNNGRYLENIKVGERYLDKFPNEEFIYNFLSIAYIKIGKDDLASKIIIKGLIFFPESLHLNHLKERISKQ